MSYTAPLKDLLFNIKYLAGYGSLIRLPGLKDADLDTVQAVLEECGRFAEQVIAPLNVVGDRQPPGWNNGEVQSSPGFKDAYRLYVQGGWQGLQHAQEYGGQGLPKTIAAACQEIFHGANLSFALCPMLTDGAIEALVIAAHERLKAVYLEKLVSGEWTGTMNLTEPQAGSDLAQVCSRAERQPDGSYRLFGTKIFITYGEHDLAENIVHLVLARVKGAPGGVKGLSLFVVPKYLVDDEGALAARNDVQCVSIEHKLGIHGSPTAVLQFGDRGGATAYLVGEENRGLEYMFIMMNAARYAVGVQGTAVSERAYQQAVSYARERIQSRPVDGSSQHSVAIIQHPDVRRMLMTMRALTEGTRATAIVAAAAYDLSHRHPDASIRAENQALYEFLVPLVKGYGTEVSQEVCSLGVQVHGGMGYIEETGAAQHYRDCRILAIYEGTTAIQANDFLARKTLRDGGAVARKIAEDVAQTEQELVAQGSDAARAMARALASARQAYCEVLGFLLAQARERPMTVYAGSVPYLMLAGNLVAAWQLGRALLAAAENSETGHDPGFMEAKIMTARFYAEYILPRAVLCRDVVLEAADTIMQFPTEQF